jgi:hypothetical protein
LAAVTFELVGRERHVRFSWVGGIIGRGLGRVHGESHGGQDPPWHMRLGGSEPKPLTRPLKRPPSPKGEG